jgi:hypothetical protein
MQTPHMIAVRGTCVRGIHIVQGTPQNRTPSVSKVKTKCRHTPVLGPPPRLRYQVCLREFRLVRLFACISNALAQTSECRQRRTIRTIQFHRKKYPPRSKCAHSTRNAN